MAIDTSIDGAGDLDFAKKQAISTVASLVEIISYFLVKKSAGFAGRPIP